MKKIITLGLFVAAIGFGIQCVSAGQLVKGTSSSAVYEVYNGKRYAFPNEKVFFTWYSDFSEVSTVTDDQLAAIPLAGNVTYRPGKKMIKITTDPKVYAVASGGTLRWITSETLAAAFYTDAWQHEVQDVSDAFFVNYMIGAPITNVSDYNPMGEAVTSPTFVPSNPVLSSPTSSSPIVETPGQSIDRTPTGVTAEYLTCMTPAEVAQYDADFYIRSADENDLSKAFTAGPAYVCNFSSNERNGLRIYNTLRFLKNISFSKPLSFTNGNTVYEFLRFKSLTSDLQQAASSTRLNIVFLNGCDVGSMGTSNQSFYKQDPRISLSFQTFFSGMMTLIQAKSTPDCKNVDLPVDSPMLLNGLYLNPVYSAALLVHESQHAIGDVFHLENGMDKTIDEMGAWAAHFYFDAWVYLYSTNVDANTKELARQQAASILQTDFSEQKCPSDPALKSIVDQIAPNACP